MAVMRPRDRLAWVLLLGVLGLASCDDCPTSSDTPGHALGGVISGRILAGGEPVRARVQATGVSDGAETHSLSAVTDDRGEFRLDCPAGDYSIQLECAGADKFYYAHGDVVSARSEREIITIGADLRHLELPLDLPRLRVSVYLTAGSRHSSIMIRKRQVREDGTIEDSGPWDSERLETGVVHLEWAGVHAGRCQLAVEVRGAGFMETFWAPGTRDPQQADPIQLTPGAATQYTFSLLDPPAEVSGVIEGSWQEFEMGRPTVEFFDPDSTLVGSSRADETDGFFSMLLKVASPIKARVEVEDVFQWIGGDDFGTASLFETVPGETTSGVDLVECGLVLDVVDPLHGSLEWMQIEVYSAGNPASPCHTISYSRSEAPRRLIPNLAPGTYFIRFTNVLLLADWTHQWIDRILTRENAQAIRVEQPGDIVLVPVSLLAGGHMHGTLFWDAEAEIPDEAGNVLCTELLVADATSQEEIGFRTLYLRTDRAEGSEFGLRGVRPGTVKFGVRIPSAGNPDLPDSTADVTIWYPGTADWDSAAVFDVESGVAIEGIEFELP